MTRIKLILLDIFLLFLCAGSIVHAEEPDIENREPQYIEKEALWTIVSEIGPMYELEPELLYALCERESSLNIYARNGICVGLAQVSQKWHAARAEKLGITDFYVPYNNVLLMADYIAELYASTGDIAYVLMMYNMAHEDAKELYEQGIITDYASWILERAQYFKTTDYFKNISIPQEENSLSQTPGDAIEHILAHINNLKLQPIFNPYG